MRKALGSTVGLLLAVIGVAACGLAGSRRGVPAAPLVAVADSVPYAVVTAGEAVFAFPVIAELSGAWPAATAVPWARGYAWGVRTYGYDRPVLISHLVEPDETRRIPPFESLDAVLRSGSLRSCYMDHFLWCAVHVRGTARAEGRRAVLRLRDCALVATLRERRPRVALFVVDRVGRRLLFDSARIGYADR